MAAEGLAGDGIDVPVRRGAEVPTARSWRGRLRRYLPLAPALLVQGVAGLRLRNTAFQDEGLYIYYGHWIIDHRLHGEALYTDPAAWFSGAPQLYPVLAALLDSAGGLELVRLFSTLCMLSATVAVYGVTCDLFGRLGQVRAGALAALVFAVSGPVLVLTHFATFDASSCTAVAWALAMGIRAGRGGAGRGMRWAVLAGVLLALAVLLKYASAIDAPFVLLAVAASGPRRPGRLPAGLRTSLLAGSTALTVLAASAATWARPLLAGVVSTTLERRSLAPETTTQLLARVVDVAGPAVALGVLGGLVTLRRRPVLGTVLLVASVAAPLYQVHTGESVSLHKTVVLGLIFGAPLAGHLCSVLVDRWWGAPLTAAVLVGSLVLGASASASIFASWPDTTPLARELTLVAEHSPGIRIAAETPEPMEYALWRHVRPWQWAGTYDGAFTYDGLSDLPAFERALSDGYFQVVVLDGTSSIGQQLRPQMQDLGYTQGAVVRAPDQEHRWVVWQRPG